MTNNPSRTVRKKREKKIQEDQIKNLDLGSEKFLKKVLGWHRQVIQDFEREFGSEVFGFVTQAIYVKTGDGEGEGTLSWIGQPGLTIDMIGHIIRQLAKDGVTQGGMTPEQAGTALVADILRVASLQNLKQYLDESIPVATRHVEGVGDIKKEKVDVSESPIWTPPSAPLA